MDFRKPCGESLSMRSSVVVVARFLEGALGTPELQEYSNEGLQKASDNDY